MDETPDIIKELREKEKQDKLKNTIFKNNKKLSKNDKKKILIVDDDPGIRLTVQYGLKEISSEYEILNAENGEECLKKLRTEDLPDLILLDIMMPKVNGWDVAAEIRKNDKWDKIPILFLTAKTDCNSKNYGSIVSNDYITKPFEIDDLKKRIDDNLKKI